MRRKDRVNCEPASNDPAAIIAQALRRKFANRMFQYSPGTVKPLNRGQLNCPLFRGVPRSKIMI